MTINGKDLVAKLKPLSSVESIKDIPQLTQAMFPGTHCPLMGAAMAVGGIKGALLVVVGTDECTYYTKSMTLHSERFGGPGGRCVSVVLDGHDVTFGSTPKMHKAFKEIVAEYKPECVFLVTTCVVEVIGDDYDAIAAELSDAYGIPVMAVHTEHFKCEDHLPGLERTITACFDMMEKVPQNDTANVLGQRMGEFKTTELYKMLIKSGVKIGMQLPAGTTVDEIKNAAAARVNIVVNDIALPLAKKMKARFGIPYVYFNKFVYPDKIYASYKELFEYLGVPLPEEIAAYYNEAKEAVTAAGKALGGVSYIYGNTPYYCFEMNAFLASLGMVPQVIQTNRFSEENDYYVQEILKHTDPLVCKAANIAPMQYVYDELHPWLYMGHEFGARLRKKGIAIVHSDAAGSMLGFEVTNYLLKQITVAAEEAKIYRKEAGL